MLKLTNKILFFIVLIFCSPILKAQNCEYTITGIIKNMSSGKPISDVNIYLKEAKIGAVSNKSGFFKIEGICAQKYHIVVSHVGCESKYLFVSVEKDTTLQIELDHNNEQLNEVIVDGSLRKNSIQHKEVLTSKYISENSEKNLANLVEGIVGVSTLKTGSGVSKPIVHGLYGSRLAIVNNGVTQSGQQWGNDHSPEIDPLVANKITVIKGVGALEYQGNSLGSVILVEPQKIGYEPHLHGKVRYFFESNGLGNGVNVELKQFAKNIGWRVLGTLKKNGDKRAANYFLTNTGGEEANLAIQVEKEFSKKVTSNFYLSTYNAQIGILKGAHIGNLTDLEEAFGRDAPFYTNDYFSYTIEAPQQKVSHYLAKLKTDVEISERKQLEITLASQLDLRKEFDVRRSGRSEKPSLSLKQFSHFLEAKYTQRWDEEWKLKTGIQYNNTNNTNIPETGINPLIPNYISNKVGFFAVINKSFEKLSFEVGGRLDYDLRNISALTTTTPKEVVLYENHYLNTSFSAGFSYDFWEGFQGSYNVGLATRNPEVNELYSNGLHQGVSGIELGNLNAIAEKSIKNTLALKANFTEKWNFESLFYHQKIADYLYLKPQNEIQLTIRGAFPVFKYEQTNARIYGMDFQTSYELNKNWSLNMLYSYLKGTDVLGELPLINMPSNNGEVKVNYQIPKIGKFENVEVQVQHKTVFKQTNLLANQDFLEAPEGYNLLGFKLGANRQKEHVLFHYFVKSENVANVAYRDYLNRQRYFADDLGFNLIVGINVSF